MSFERNLINSSNYELQSDWIKKKNFAVLINCTNQVIIKSSADEGRQNAERKAPSEWCPFPHTFPASHERSADPSGFWNWKRKKKTVNRPETAEASWGCVGVSKTVRRVPAGTGVSAHLEWCK